MKAFLDCEFTDLDADAKLISLALVTEGGQEFYVELTDSYRLEECSWFAIEHVLPQLRSSLHGCTTAQAQARMTAFIKGLHTKLEICSDAPGRDWRFFCELIGGSGSWPASVAREPADSTEWFSSLDDGDFDQSKIKPAHHALLDARGLSRLYQEMNAEKA